jgi:alpha(1,3/1,4) fucosyltransferase
MPQRIGITVSFQHSVFSSGASQTSLALAELFSYLGYTCSFIHVGDESWWNDVPSLRSSWPCIRHTEVTPGQFDRILEVTLCPSLRSLAPCIWIVRKTPLFFDMEACVVPYPLPKRDLEGIAETWVQEELASSDDIQYLELLTRKPVRTLPFLWSAIAIEAFRKETKPPIWQQTYVPGESFTVHICETNTTSASSCVIPICIFRDSLRSHGLKIHNAEALKDSEYFRKNLWDNLTGDLSLPDPFVGRQRIVEIPSGKNTVILAHSRFTTIRPYHLDALWCGIPLVHNSSLLQEIPHASRGYYPNNDILAASSAAKDIMTRWITQAELFEVRKAILHRFGILNASLQNRWKEALDSVSAAAAAAKKKINIGFSDMWQGFNPSYNFFTLLLERTYTVNVSESPDVLIFGPFGSQWKKYTCPKIHYTGENTPPVTGDGVVLNLGFQRRDDNYIRLPLWMLEIDWFAADPVLLNNPKPIPLEPTVATQREKFCAFVVSNPCQPVRNRAFHALSMYKEVDSAGSLFNTLGTALFAGAGGGGGERAKVEFLRQYKFCLAYENAQSPGYVTEKLFHAKAAGCVPIYWGAPDVELDFCMDGVIDARGKTEEEMVAMVRKVDEDSSLWLKMANTPLLRGSQRESSLLDKVAEAIAASAAAPSPAPAPAPAPASAAPAPAAVKLPAPNLGNTVFVTVCNQKFVDTLLKYWIPPLMVQKNVSTNIQIHVYLMQDVTHADKTRISSAFPTVQLYTLPTTSYFPDCWNPQHFLWKLWILKETCRTVTAGYPVIYLDTGVFFCRWPKEWITYVKREGICVLEDANHDNRHMCSKSFCKELQLTEEELADPQIWAGAMSFVAQDPRATRLLEEAWILGQNPKVIVGDKWTGVDGNKPMGHRHDQSILSVLSRRHGLPRLPLNKVYCHTSLRHTFLQGLSLYVHRGFFVVNDPVASGVDTAWIINLDRRPDRLARSKIEKAIRFPAIDGKTLRLTPDLVRMFSSSHNIGWRKGVMACALSHISLWTKLVADKPEIQSYLILEDDAVLDPQWMPLLNHIDEKKLLPADCDVLYLGGILPPNKEGFASVIEPVNECIGRVKENTLFSQKPSRNFHFCAYSYILRRSGAEKLCAMLKTGCWAPADHLLCNSVKDLNLYFTLPLVAGCYQDTDPKYAVSDFNTFGKEEYDSDLRNEDVFSQEEVLACTTPGEFSLERALTVDHKLIERQKSPLIFHDVSGLFEKEWLEELLGQPLDKIETEVPIVLYQRPHCQKLMETLKSWPAFTLLHLSDEGGLDPIEIYDWPACKGVVRNYVREGLSSKVVTIPLGYHWSAAAAAAAANAATQKKDLLWSFIGAEYGGRRDKLHPFKGLLPNKCVFQKEWNSPTKCGKEEVVDSLKRSLGVPCPGGVNYETFRIYEALEAGAIPMLVEEAGSEAFLAYLKKWIPLATSPDWTTSARILHGLSQKPDLYREYQKSLALGWASLKVWAKTQVRKTLLV